MLMNSLKITWRNIKNQNVYSFINIMGLAVGMTCCILILLWVRDEIGREKFHVNFSDLYRTVPELQGEKYIDNPLALTPVLRDQYPEVLKIERFCGRHWLLRRGETMAIESGALVDDDFLKMFSFPLIEGNPIQLPPAVRFSGFDEADGQEGA